MKTATVVVALAALLATGAAHAAGAVQVSFVKPENFADIRDRAYSREQNLKALEQIFTSVAQPYVADGQTLKIEVLDVDLAGEVRPGARAWDVRVLRGRADWPRITFRWSVEGAGAAPRSGEAVVQDMAYLQRLQPPLSDTSLIYERRMLDEWFRQQFAKTAVN
jgi:Protein of unknown function (DUF3016)